MKNMGTKELREKLGLGIGDLLAWWGVSILKTSEGNKAEVYKYGCIKRGWKRKIAQVEVKVFTPEGNSNMCIALSGHFDSNREAMNWLGDIRSD